MDYKYEALDQNGKPASGTITAVNQDAAIDALQRRGLTVTAFSGLESGGLFKRVGGRMSFFQRLSTRDLVLLSRQIATLFEAQVSALRVFRLLGEQADKPYLRSVLTQVGDDLQAGSSISKALNKHPKAFSDFYVNMVRAGEESGKLDETFIYLADYTERSYELTSKARNALVYPGFIMLTFLAVMILMFTVVIPKIGAIISESGQELPFVTVIVLGISNFLLSYGIFLFAACIIGGYFLIRWIQTPAGHAALSSLQLSIPYIGSLYQKLYLARISDNIHIMLTSGISAVRSLEITASVVGNDVYEGILHEALESVKAGTTLSQAFSKHPNEVPAIMVQMLQIGEETGELGKVLERLAKFYAREVNAAVDTLVALIEPALIISLAVGIGILLAAVLLPIYNTAGSI